MRCQRPKSPQSAQELPLPRTLGAPSPQPCGAKLLCSRNSQQSRCGNKEKACLSLAIVRVVARVCPYPLVQIRPTLMLLLGRRNFISSLICSLTVQPCFQKLWGCPKCKPDKARELKMQEQTCRGSHWLVPLLVSRAHPWGNSDIQWPVES